MIKVLIVVIYFVSLFFITFWLLVLAEKGVVKEKPSLNIKKGKIEKVSICIPVYNVVIKGEKSITKTLNSIFGLDYPKNKIEIIVVDDGSTDNTNEKIKEIIKKHPEYNIILITRKKNSGRAAAKNTGLRAATGIFFITLDADSVIKPNALRKIVPYFDDPEVAAVLPLIKIQYKKTIMQKIQQCEFLINFFYKKLMYLLNCVHVTPGPFSVYRKSIIKKIGGFDKKPNLVEDLEMAFNLQKHHYKIIQLLGTCALANQPATLVQFYKQRNRWYKGSLINLLSRKYRGMMLNHKYGDLGVFQFPMIIISAILSIAIFIIIFGIYILKPLIINIHNLSYINFDIIPLIKSFVQNFAFRDLNLIPVFYGTTIFSLALVFLGLAHYYTRESLIKNIKCILLYFILYPFILSIIWIGIIFDTITGNLHKEW